LGEALQHQRYLLCSDKLRIIYRELHPSPDEAYLASVLLLRGQTSTIRYVGQV